MKKTVFSFALLIVVIAFSTTSCKKNVRKGCTDPASINYDYLAEEDDGSCEYTDSSFTIWANGESGYWGSPFTGSFQVSSCLTGITTIDMNGDTTITPADTVIDNSVTPPDTTITPADTTYTGDTYLLVNSDTNGNYELMIRLLNKQNAQDFKNGILYFDAMLHPDAQIEDFGVYIYGNNFSNGGSYCEDFHYSDLVSVFTSTLDTGVFRTVSIPLIDFPGRRMQDIDVVFGIKGTGAQPNTPLIIINNVWWTSKDPSL